MTKKQKDVPVAPKPEPKQLSEFSEIELKAALGDLFLERESLQQRIQLIHQRINNINQELTKRKK